MTTAVMRNLNTIDCDGREKKGISQEDMERNVTLCLHNSFCRNRENTLDLTPCCKQMVEEQRCWRSASNSVRTNFDMLLETATESAESMSQLEEMEH